VKYKLALFLFFGVFASFSQTRKLRLEVFNKKIDSLYKIPKSFARDTALVILLNLKANVEINEGVNVDSVFKLNEKALELSNKHNWRFGKMFTYYMLSENENIKGRYFSVINYCLKVLSLVDKKTEWYFYEKALGSAGAAYMWIDKPKDAKKFYELFFDYMKNKSTWVYKHPLENKPKKAQNHINDALTEMGILYIKYEKDEVKAFDYLSKAKANYVKLKDNFGLGYMGSYLGLTYERLGKIKLAETEFENSFRYLKEQGADYLLADAYNNASEFYFRQNDLTKAEYYAKSALEIGERIGIFFSIRDANQNLFAIANANRDYRNALLYHQKFAAIKDSMSEANYEDKMKVIRYEFDTESQKQEIEKKTLENQKKNNLIYSLIFGIIAVAIIGFIVIRNMNYKRKLTEKEMERLQQERQLLATNSVLKGQEEERSRLARDLHDGLGGLLSGIKLNLSSIPGNVVLSTQNAEVFSQTISQLDNAITELRRVAHSMLPESLLKFGLKDAISDYCEGINHAGKLKIHFQSFGIEDLKLEQSTEITLYRIVQELLNNVMKHAEAKEAFVQIVQSEGTLTITVEDDGKGFDINTLNEKKGIGISNIENRVEYLKGKMDIQTEPNKGTSTVIEIKI
jgi:two-component system, NarL family, sensor kinase